jgi:hypothetical protein
MRKFVLKNSAGSAAHLLNRAAGESLDRTCLIVECTVPAGFAPATSVSMFAR